MESLHGFMTAHRDPEPGRDEFHLVPLFSLWPSTEIRWEMARPTRSIFPPETLSRPTLSGQVRDEVELVPTKFTRRLSPSFWSGMLSAPRVAGKSDSPAELRPAP